MYKYSYVLVFLICLSSCAQNSREQNLNNMLSELKKYDKEPLYQIKIESNLSYSILVNDIPVINNYEFEAYYSGNNINNCIFKSGIQNLKIDISPKINIEGLFEEFIGNNKIFKLTVEQTSWVNGSLEDPKIILSYDLKDKINSDSLDLSYLKSFVDIIDFQATIPYKIKSWEESKLFKEQDIERLLPMVISFYENMKRKYENQQGEMYAKILGKGYFNISQSNYLTPDEARSKLQKQIDFINKKQRSLAPLENYELRLFGNGKLIGLKRKDTYNKGEGVIRRYYKKGSEKVKVDDILLHMPLDSDEFEIIWYSGLVKAANP